MAVFADGALMEVETGILYVETRQLLTPCTTLIYDNLSNDDQLRTAVVNDLIAEGVLTNSNRRPCIQDPSNLISLLPSKTNDQLEKFFVIFLRTLRGAAAAQEARRQIREDFAWILLQQVQRAFGNNPATRIHTIHGHYYEFAECVRNLLCVSGHRLPTHFDYARLGQNLSYKERILPDFTPANLC